MNDYELMYVLHPRLSEQEIDAFVDNVSSIVNNYGEVLTVDRWGRRRLAYPIGQNMEGFYILTTFNARPEIGHELESQLNLSENVLRHLIIKGIIPYEGVVKDRQELQGIESPKSDGENNQEDNSVEVIEDSGTASEEEPEVIEDSGTASEEEPEVIEDSGTDSEDKAV